MGKARILVVDDAAFIRGLMKQILSTSDFEVAGEAIDGAEAVLEYDRLLPDAVLMDIIMPGVDGIEAVRQIVRKHPEARIIMCSAIGHEDVVVEALAAGARDFIVKPFMPKKVIETLRARCRLSWPATSAATERDVAMIDMCEYKDLFVSEARGHLAAISQSLMAWEQGPADRTPAEKAFRLVHTVKGMAGTMGYEQLARFAHGVEDLLDRVRRDDLAASPELFQLLFAGVDMLNVLVREVAEDREQSHDLQPALERMRLFQPFAAGAPSADTAEPTNESVLLSLRIELSEDCSMKSARAFAILRRLRDWGMLIACEPSESELLLGRFEGEFWAFLGTARPITLVERDLRGMTDVAQVAVRITDGTEYPAGGQPDATPAPAAVPPTGAETAPARLSAGYLDQLVELIGELVPTRSRLWEAQARLGDADLANALGAHDRVLNALRDAALQARLLPAAQVFHRFPRLVRDLLREEGKQAELIIEGEELELDRALLESLGEPIVHLLRNAVVHGIEPPAERKTRGKTAEGTIRLAARRLGRDVAIEVSDDGRGLSCPSIGQIALARQIVTEEELARMSEQQVFMLICSPSFSTAAVVTQMAGRGIGMNIVKRMIEGRRGSLEIISEDGLGTTFRLRVPAVFAAGATLTAYAGGVAYAVPLAHVDRTLDVPADSIRWAGRRGELVSGQQLPVYRLSELLGAAPAAVDGAGGALLVVGRGPGEIGLLVDRLLGVCETPPDEQVSLLDIAGLVASLS